MITDLALIEPWVLGMYLLMTTAFTIPLVILFALVMKRPDKNAQLAKEVSYSYVGEHVSYEDEEPEDEHPAMADTMPTALQLQLRQRKTSPAPQQQNPRRYLRSTTFEKGGHMANFFNGRGLPRTGRVERHKNIGEKDVVALVNKDGNRLWVSSAQ